jgi:oxygen-dependent protoporphyrinogen oxidase
MTYDHKPKVVVVGAGVAGLAAARCLARAGVGVIVLEKDSHVGGRVYTQVVDGFEIDAGAQFIANFCPHTLRLIRELGLQEDLVRIPGAGAVLRAGRLYGIWPDLRLVFTGLISPLSKLTLLKPLGPLLRHWGELDLHAFHKAHRLDTRSIADYARQELNREILEYVIQPPLTGIFYLAPEQASQALIFLLIKASLGVRIFTLRHGLGRLSEAMAADLLVHRNAEVVQVTPNEAGGCTVRAYIDGEERSFSVDGVVCATPAAAVPDLFPNLSARQRSFFEAIRYSVNITAAIGIERRLPSAFYGLLFPRREAGHLALAAIQSAKNPAQVPVGRDLVTLHSSDLVSRELWEKDDDAIQDMLRSDLRQAGPAYDLGEGLFCRTYRWRYAIPDFDVGHFKRLKRFADGEIETGQVVFAGDYLGGPYIEGAITSGLDAAGRLLQRLETRPHPPR